MVFCVGLTGSIASGKTTVAEIFASFGINRIQADAIAKELTEKDTPAYQKIVDHFGLSVLLEDKTINRRTLRQLIFSNPIEREWLEQLLHPLILLELKKQINLCKSPYCIVEIPLLVDKIQYPYLNKILVITAPPELQIARIIERDHCSKEEALAIISSQPDMDLRLKHADDVINNAFGFVELKKAVEALHFKYLSTGCPRGIDKTNPPLV